MTLDEFVALEPGDKIENGNGQIGVVTGYTPSAVHVRWGAEGGPSFTLQRMSTVWFGFTVHKKSSFGAEDATASGDGAAELPRGRCGG